MLTVNTSTSKVLSLAFDGVTITVNVHFYTMIVKRRRIYLILIHFRNPKHPKEMPLTLDQRGAELKMKKKKKKDIMAIALSFLLYWVWSPFSVVSLPLQRFILFNCQGLLSDDLVWSLIRIYYHQSNHFANW